MQRKLEIMPLIEQVRDEFKVPIVYISHAIEEVVRLATTIVVIDAGRVKAIGSPGEVFGRVSAHSAEERFDRASVLTMKVVGANAAYGLTELQHPSGTVWLAGPAAVSYTHLDVYKRQIQDGEKDSIKTVRGSGTRLMETFAGDDLNQS